MSKRKKIIRVLSAIILVVLLWIVFLLIRGLFERKISHHEQFIPEKVESVLEIKSEALIRTFLEDILVEGSLDGRFKQYVKPSEDDTEPLGIDFLGNCYVFTFQESESSFTGILVNVLDEPQFLKAMGQSADSGVGYAVRNGVGLMLFQSGDKLAGSNQLKSRADKLITSPSKFDLKRLKPHVENSKVNYWTKEYAFNEKKTFTNVHLSLRVEGNELKMQGNAGFKSTENRNYPVLVKKDLSIQTQFIPNYVNELWTGNMQNLGLPFPKLTYISGNYHYSEPSPVKGIKVLPNFDGIYAFDENFQIRIPLIALAASKKISSLNLNSFNLGDKKIYYKQIDQKTVYLGQSKYDAKRVEQNALLEVNGDLRQLLEIRNGKMLETFLKLSPEFNATERFLSNIETSNFHIKDSDGEKVDLLGEITFNNGKSALNETVVFLMNLGYLQ